jgi:hypothetical protein
MGRSAVLWQLYPIAAALPSSVSHGRREALTKTAMCGPGDAVGAKLGTTSIKRTSVNVGSDRCRPRRLAASRADGQARRPLLASVVAESP